MAPMDNAAAAMAAANPAPPSHHRPSASPSKTPAVLKRPPTIDRPTRFKWLALLAVPISIAFHTGDMVGISASLASLAGFATYHMVPALIPSMVAASLAGHDLNKADLPLLPESMGIAAGAMYLIALFMFIPVPFMGWIVRNHGSAGLAAADPFPFQQLGEYTAALLSVCCMLFLGFADDVLNLKWRHKLLLPAMASLPLLMIYKVTCDLTVVVVPWPFRLLPGLRLINLGPLYYAYMAAMAVFCTHSINILAGVNGVEVGQSVIIAISVIINNVLAIRAGESSAHHQLSVYLLLPFLAVSLALLRHNWFPARVFVGDTYCYFAGMTFAVVAILGHFSKTMLLFFVPQILNFLYSTPQLFRLIPCPRHRLPRLDPNSGCLQPSTVTFQWNRLSRTGRLVCATLHRLRLVRHYDDPVLCSPSASVGQADSATVTINNLTLLNFLLVLAGPMREDRLAMLLLVVQAATNAVGFVLRYKIAAYLFPLLAPTRTAA